MTIAVLGLKVKVRKSNVGTQLVGPQSSISDRFLVLRYILKVLVKGMDLDLSKSVA